MPVTLYSLPNTYGAIVAKHETGEWSMFPAIAGGWKNRREWTPAPAYARRIESAHNGIQHIYRAELLEIPHQMRWFGFDETDIPKGNRFARTE